MSTEKHNVLAGVHDDCEVCKTGHERCEELKDRIQELMNQGVLQFSKEIDGSSDEESSTHCISCSLNLFLIKILRLGLRSIMQLSQLVVKKFRFLVQRLSIYLVQGG